MAYIMIVEGGKHRMVRQVGYREEKGEETLQDLVEKHPDLLPLPGVESGDLAILTVHREFKATDLLCVDSNGGITIVECKLSDNQTMREIVAQLLDYASILWKSTYQELNQRASEYLKQDVAEAMLQLCREKGIVGEDEDEEEWKDDFRNRLINTLETGAFTLVIVADEVPHDIRRAAEYLSLYSMPVYPVEIRYFPSDKDLEVMVPHLIEFGKRSSTPPSTRRGPIDKQSFLELCEEEVKAIAESIIDFLETLESEGRGFIEYGGRVGGTAKFYAPNRKRIFSLVINGEIWMILRPKIGVAEAVLQEYISKLNEISIFRYYPRKDIGFERKSQAGVDKLGKGEIDKFHETIAWILSKISAGASHRGKDSVGD